MSAEVIGNGSLVFFKMVVNEFSVYRPAGLLQCVFEI